MQRLCAALICCGLVQLAAPTRAYAWLDWLEHWSGPGPFWGWDIETRLVCIVDDGSGPKAVAVPPVGVILGTCSDPPEDVRAWVDLGFRFLNADGEARFAGGHDIQFTTIEPSVTFRLIRNAKWSFVDYGIGAGAFWVSSRGFPSLNGAFLEPLRLDFHTPPGNTRVRQVLGAFVFRFGLLVFPSGFEPDVFAATDPERIPRDWVKTAGVFFKLDF